MDRAKMTVLYQSEVETVQLYFDKLEDDYMTLEVEAGLSSNEEEVPGVKSQTGQIGK